KTSGDETEEQYSIPLGKADIKREDTDATIVATAMMVHKSLEAAELLAEKGINVGVVDTRTLVPFDTETAVESVKKTGRLLVVHEAVKFDGIGGDIASLIAVSEAYDTLEYPIVRQ